MANLNIKVTEFLKKFYDVKEDSNIKGLYEIRKKDSPNGELLWYVFSSNNATYHSSGNNCAIRDINQSNSGYIDRLKSAYECAKKNDKKFFWLVMVFGDGIGLPPQGYDWMASVELRVSLDDITASLSMRTFPVGKGCEGYFEPCCIRYDQDKYFSTTFISCKDNDGEFTSQYIDSYFNIYDNRPYHSVIEVEVEVPAVDEDESEDDSLREQFVNYITNVLGLKSTRQVGDLGKLSAMLLAAGVIEKDVYQISDPSEYAITLDIIRNSEVYKKDKQDKKEKSPYSGLAYDQGMTNYAKFLEYLREDHKDDEGKDTPALVYETGITAPFSRNRIIFGAPGTGKSFTINRDRSDLLGDGYEVDYERVTFHPDYSFASFVGTYKPVMRREKTSLALDANTDYVLSVLNDTGRTGQEKYDILFEIFQKDNSLTRLPLLLGLYTDEIFKTKKADGTNAAGDNSVERNHGKAIRKYVNLIDGKESASEIAYEYVPGPFMRMYVKALKNARTANPKPYLLIIEEINRANVAAVFGDIFQLLDRDEYGVSEYPVQASEDVKKYLAKELGGTPDDYDKIKIPDNLFIWATMNSADQGVFPMDTAFKRRWDFTYLGIDDKDEDIRGKYVVVGTKEQQRIEWNSLRKAINEFLAEQRINEDKQLGPYFLARSIVVPSDGGNEIDSKKFCDVFKYKVLMYLFEDAAKQKRNKLFEGSARGQARYSKICEAFDEQGIGIFHADIQNMVIKTDLKTNGYNLDENGAVMTTE